MKNDKPKNQKFSYKAKAYRLDDKTIKALASIKKDLGKSYNLTFLKLIALHKKYKNREI